MRKRSRKHCFSEAEQEILPKSRVLGVLRHHHRRILQASVGLGGSALETESNNGEGDLSFEGTQDTANIGIPREIEERRCGLRHLSKRSLSKNNQF